MKTRLLFCMAVATFFFSQQLVAQDVSSVLRNKEKRQMLYSSIINSDAMFLEFMESTKASGRTNDGIKALNNGNSEALPAQASTENGTSEDQMVMKQMVSLMKEYSAANPAFQKMIEEKYPEVGKMMKNEKMEL